MSVDINKFFDFLEKKTDTSISVIEQGYQHKMFQEIKDNFLFMYTNNKIIFSYRKQTYHKIPRIGILCNLNTICNNDIISSTKVCDAYYLLVDKDSISSIKCNCPINNSDNYCTKHTEFIGHYDRLLTILHNILTGTITKKLLQVDLIKKYVKVSMYLIYIIKKEIFKIITTSYDSIHNSILLAIDKSTQQKTNSIDEPTQQKIEKEFANQFDNSSMGESPNDTQELTFKNLEYNDFIKDITIFKDGMCNEFLLINNVELLLNDDELTYNSVENLNITSNITRVFCKKFEVTIQADIKIISKFIHRYVEEYCNKKTSTHFIIDKYQYPFPVISNDIKIEEGCKCKCIGIDNDTVFEMRCNSRLVKGTNLCVDHFEYFIKISDIINKYNQDNLSLPITKNKPDRNNEAHFKKLIQLLAIIIVKLLGIEKYNGTDYNDLIKVAEVVV